MIKINPVKKKTIDNFLLVLYIVVNCRLFYLVSLPGKFGGAASNKLLEALVALMIFTVTAFLHKKIVVGKFGYWISALYLILIVNAVSIEVKYSYKLTTVIWPLIQFLILLMYFPLKDYLKVKKNRDFFIKAAEICSIILSVLFLIQRFTYKGYDSNFLKISEMISRRHYYMPYLGLRIYSVFDGFLRVFVIVAAYRIIKNQFKKCRLDIVTFLSVLMAIVFVDQSRFYLITVIVTCVFMFFYHNKLRIKRKVFYIMGIVLVLTAGVLFIKVKSIFGSMNMESGSTYARLGAISYYAKKVAFNPLGLGLAVPAPKTPEYYFVKGPDGIFNYDDIGLFGVLGSLGIPGFIWYVGFAVKNLLIAINSKCDKCLKLGITVSFIIAMPLMSYLDAARIPSLLFLMVFMDTKFDDKEDVYVLFDNYRL